MAVHSTAPGPPVAFVDGPTLRGEVAIPAPALRTSPAAEVEDLEAVEERLRWEAEVELQRQTERNRIVQGLDNEDLHALLRTFDKHVHNVHICAPPAPSDIPAALDLHPSEHEEFTLDKMKSNLERFYSSVIVGLLRASMEIERIRRWEEGGKRSAVALLTYTLAWFFNRITTTVLLFFTMLILVPASRSYCFQAPRNSEAEKKQKISGPSTSEDKAAEWAGSMVDLITAFTSPGGKKGPDVEQQLTQEVNGMVVKDMRKKETALNIEGMSDKDKAIELYARPTMRIIGGLADKWERVANCLNPTPPFILEPHRTRVFCWLVAPALVLSTCISERMFSRVFGISFGFLMFGQPVIDRCLEELDRRYPHWFENLITQHNILSDVPTNAQLIIRLLRDAEHKRRPLPHADANKAQEGAEQEVDHSVTSTDDESDNEDEDMGRKAKMSKKMIKTKEKVSVGFRAKVRNGWDKAGRLKEESFAFITGHKEIDYESKAKTALDKLHISENAKAPRALLDRLPDASAADSPDSPSRFYVHHAKHGPGHLIIHPPTVSTTENGSFTPARLTFTTIRHVPASENISIDPAEPSKSGNLIISINDVVSLKKEGLSWPSRIVATWALDTQGAGGTGMEIKVARRGPPVIPNGHGVDDEALPKAQGTEETIKLKGIVRRDELFSRLLTVGEQQWELL